MLVYGWSDVFSLTKDFQEAAPWEHIGDNHLFAFFDEKSKIPIVCSVLGYREDNFGLAIYIGREGLMSLVHSYLIDHEFEQMNTLHTQRSVLLSLKNREDVTKEAYAFLTKHKGSFHGKKAWPTYTSYRPGFYPWHCSEQEIAYLVQALERVLQLTKDVKEGLYMPSFPEEEKMLFQEWNERKTAADYTSIYVENVHARLHHPKLALSELDLKRVKKVKRKIPVTVEFSYQYLFTPIQKRKGQRPYFPVIVLALDHEDGSLIFHELFDKPIDTEVIQQMFLKTIHALRGFPEQLIVDEKTEYHLLALIEELAILDDLRDRLIHTEMFLEEMMESTSGD